MAQISKNGFDLIGISLHKMRGKALKGFLGTFMYVLPLALLCLIPYAGWALALFFWGVLNTGYIRYMRALMNGNNPSIWEVFSEVRTGWFELYLGALILTMFILGSAVLFVPGVLLIGYYSLSMYTAEYFHIESVGEALYQTAIRMDGNKTTMFSYKAIFYFIYALIMVALGFTAWGVYLLWGLNPVIAVLVGMLAFLVYVILWSFVTIYFHAVNETMFQEILAKFEYKNTEAFRNDVLAKKEKEEQPAEAAPAPEVKEEPAPATEAKPQPKKAAAKPAAKKAPAKKPAAKKK